MLTSIAFVLCLAITSVQAHKAAMGYGGRAQSVEVSICETQQPDDALRSLHQELSAKTKLRKVKPRQLEPILVDTYFHFVVPSETANTYTTTMRDQLARAQLDALNKAYATMNVAFHLATNPSFTVNTTWATNGDDMTMKSALRNGTYSSLNIYFQSALQPPPTPGSLPANDGAFLLGYCELPTSVTHTVCDSPSVFNPLSNSDSGCKTTTTAPEEYVSDGCNVLLASMPGGGMQTYDEGKTAVHEVGHWFGLLHTFQDQTCEPGATGDFISDTPQEAVATEGCPVVKDSCPGQEGLDPVNNYMDYSSDACYTQFTSMQSERVAQLWSLMRKGY